MMLFNEFARKYNLKSKATSNVKIYEVLKKIVPDSKVGIYLRDGPYSSDIGVANLYPSNKTHWVCYINENNFDSYGLVPPRKLSKFIKKRNGHCLYSVNQKQKSDSFCASYCIYLIYLVNVLGIDFKSAVLNMYYQKFF